MIPTGEDERVSALDGVSTPVERGERDAEANGEPTPAEGGETPAWVPKVGTKGVDTEENRTDGEEAAATGAGGGATACCSTARGPGAATALEAGDGAGREGTTSATEAEVVAMPGECARAASG
jgi:hypothetical protein